MPVQLQLAFACCPLDAGQTDIMINRHDRDTRPSSKIKEFIYTHLVRIFELNWVLIFGLLGNN